MGKFPEDQKIVVYCFDADCPSSERLASEMKFMGYDNVMIYEDGWDTWQNMGYPIEGEDGNE